MTFDDYQAFVIDLIQPKVEGNLSYFALGLGGEAGEVQEKIKKYLRDDVIKPSEVAKELGDVLFYLTAIADTLGYSLLDIAYRNQVKLRDRQRRGVLGGNGDNR